MGAPASLPALQFLGAEKSLAGYRSALNARLAQWRPERSVRLNLEAVLDVKFPSPQEVRTVRTYCDFTGETSSLQGALNRPRVHGATARPPSLQACSAGAEEYSVECAVCYMYDLDGCVPEIACDGCSKPFHKACLYEWLSALPSTRQSFNRLFGECPYCSRPVTVEAS